MINYNESINLYLFCCDSTFININKLRSLAIKENSLKIDNHTFKYSILKSNVTVQLTANRATRATSQTPQVPTNSQLLDPDYDPCNCDLNLNKCDLNCCCDLDCTKDDFNTFRIPCKSKTRNILENSIEPWTCRDIYNDPKKNVPDWFPIICVNVRLFLY
jgi:hypothetical protein